MVDDPVIDSKLTYLDSCKKWRKPYYPREDADRSSLLFRSVTEQKDTGAGKLTCIQPTYEAESVTTRQPRRQCEEATMCSYGKLRFYFVMVRPKRRPVLRGKAKRVLEMHYRQPMNTQRQAGLRCIILLIDICVASFALQEVSLLRDSEWPPSHLFRMELTQVNAPITM